MNPTERAFARIRVHFRRLGRVIAKLYEQINDHVAEGQIINPEHARNGKPTKSWERKGGR